MRLIPGTTLYNQWLNPPLDVFMSFNIFNIKNGADFLNGSKPIFEEIGPFVYREYATRDHIIDNLNFTLTYNQVKRYEFVPEMSPYEETYQITTLNMAAITVVNQIKYMPSIIHDAVNVALTLTGDNSLFVTKSARELLFGYEDKFLKTLKKLTEKIDPNLVPTVIVGFYTGVKLNI